MDELVSPLVEALMAGKAGPWEVGADGREEGDVRGRGDCRIQQAVGQQLRFLVVCVALNRSLRVEETWFLESIAAGARR